jgi:hypothetical protein
MCELVHTCGDSVRDAEQLERIDVGAKQIDIRFRPTRLGAILDLAPTPLSSATDDETQIPPVPVRLRAPGGRSEC